MFFHVSFECIIQLIGTQSHIAENIVSILHLYIIVCKNASRNYIENCSTYIPFQVDLVALEKCILFSSNSLKLPQTFCISEAKLEIAHQFSL